LRPRRPLRCSRSTGKCRNSSAGRKLSSKGTSTDKPGCSEVKNRVSLKKILIVDDSLAEVRLMQAVLEQAGYWPVAIHDPTTIEATIDVEHPGLILLDVVMPQRNGFQVCRELKSNPEYERIPVVLVTSKDGASDKVWGQMQGADDYVVKPFTREQLLQAVQKYL
jgi:DNA-binding response OmpR family regulator